MSSASDYLYAAIDELVAQREQLLASVAIIDTEIAAVNNSIARLAGASASALPGARRGVAAGAAAGGRSVREVIVDIGSRQGRFTVDDVTSALQRSGHAVLPTSISSIISRLRADGVLLRGDRRGEYIYSGERGATIDATSDAVASASDQDDPTAVPNAPADRRDRSDAANAENPAPG